MTWLWYTSVRRMLGVCEPECPAGHVTRTAIAVIRPVFQRNSCELWLRLETHHGSCIEG